MFDNSQLQAVNHYLGPAIILSGPGSGKTTVITNRIKNLIENHDVSPDNILVVTFTRSAAMEMKERFTALPKNKFYKGFVTFGTFHSIFYMILKNAYNYSSENIVSEDMKIEIIQNLFSYHDIEESNELVFKVLSEISTVKNDLLDIDNYYSKNLGAEIFRDIFKSYNKILEDRNKVDFDDMLLMTYELFTKRGDILESYRKKFKFIMIDEFQDINKLQYEIIMMLAKPLSNIFIVGDDDQSIYGFRGARPYLMRRFMKEFENCRSVVLNHNYRSTNEVVFYSSKLIKNNKNRLDKELVAARNKNGNVYINAYRDIHNENEGVVEKIRNNIEAGLQYEDIAILYRTNHIPFLLVQKLLKYNIPFVAKGLYNDIFSHFIFRDIKAYINIAMGSHERRDYLRIINKPLRYVKREVFTSERVNMDAVINMYADKSFMMERLEKFMDDVELLGDMIPFAAIGYIRKAVGYDEYLINYAKEKNIDADQLFEILDSIHESSRDCESFKEWFEKIEKLIIKLREASKNDNTKKNALSLMTMHAAKGLEYPVVYIIQANEGITPHRKSVLPEDIEEERRLFYVALTRAKEDICISYCEKRFNRPAKISRFVKEIME